MKGRDKGDTSTHTSNNAFRESYDRVFGKKKINLRLDATRCMAVDECEQRDDCARYLARFDDVGDRWVSPSLFPYDISLGDLCPMFLEVELYGL